MKKRIHDRLLHGLISLLLAAGLMMPLLGIMDASFLSTRFIVVSAGIILILEIVSLHRISAWISGIVLIASGVVFAFNPNGARIVSDFLIAVTLRIRGMETTLPLIAESSEIIVTAAVTLISFAASFRKATCIPSVILSIAVTVLIWLTDHTELLSWILPALAAVLTMILTARYEDTAAERVLPWAAVIVAVSFAMCLGGAAIQPAKEKADELRQSLMDRLFFTEARDVFSLYSVGYSPQGPDQLGGRPDPDPSPVMQVSTPRTVYLRGTVYDQYTGHAWKNTSGGRRYLWQSDRMKEEKDRIFNQSLPDQEIMNSLSHVETVIVRILHEGATTLFVPQRVREFIPGSDMVPYYSNSSEMFATRNLQPEDTYSVRAPLYTCTDAGIENLIQACSSMDDPMWDAIPEIYTDLPGHLEQPVYDLARNITDGADTPFRKAMAIRNWLYEHCRYTLDVDEHPENIDFVTSFLIDTRKGYCTYFASAMTVLCRMAGLPARYVEGYLARPDEHGVAVVTGMDAHAWTEVYFKGFGWLTFDAVPGLGREPENGPDSGLPDGSTENSPTPSPEPETAFTTEPTPESSADPTPTPTEKDTDDPTPSAESQTPPPSPENDNSSPEPTDRNGPENRTGGAMEKGPGNTLLSYFIILIALAILLAVRIILTSPTVKAKRADSEYQKTEIWIREIFELLACENMIRRTGETPIGFARRVDSTAMFTTSIEPAGVCISVLRYSSSEPLPEDTDEMKDIAVLLRTEITRPAKIRYWFRRIFIPMRKRNRIL